jgi:hypothetical protein
VLVVAVLAVLAEQALTLTNGVVLVVRRAIMVAQLSAAVAAVAVGGLPEELLHLRNLLVLLVVKLSP